VGAMTPLVQGGHKPSRYWAAPLAHTLGCVVAGAGLGAILGLVGHGALGARGVTGGAIVVAGVGVTLGLGELGLLKLPVMQAPRQTVKQWRELLGPVGAPLAWGLDLGSGLTTYVPYTAYWLLPLAAVARGDVQYGALVLAMFGLARALTVAVASLSTRGAAASPIIGAGTPFHADLLQLAGHTSTFRREHGLGLMFACMAVLVYLTI
jgi:hypothetical protein